jgi:hypothetical protein
MRRSGRRHLFPKSWNSGVGAARRLTLPTESGCAPAHVDDAGSANAHQPSSHARGTTLYSICCLKSGIEVAFSPSPEKVARTQCVPDEGSHITRGRAPAQSVSPTLRVGDPPSPEREEGKNHREGMIDARLDNRCRLVSSAGVWDAGRIDRQREFGTVCLIVKAAKSGAAPATVGG